MITAGIGTLFTDTCVDRQTLVASGACDGGVVASRRQHRDDAKVGG